MKNLLSSRWRRWFGRESAAEPQVTQPLVAQRAPVLMELAPGDYRWCACGRSQRQPFCDGSHAGSGIEPVPFTVTARSGTLWLCGCKHSRRKPHCDGSHNRIA